MAAKWIEVLTGSLEEKKQYRQIKARMQSLPEPYAAAAKAVERYAMATGGIADGPTLITMYGDLADLWERAAADGTPVRDIVGENPADFAESFVRAYNGKEWIDSERKRLNKAIADAERGERS